jgi:hypothetical protein
MVEVYDFVAQQVVANGTACKGVGLHLWNVENCLPLAGPQVNQRYSLRDGYKHISVVCIAQGVPGIQTASFREV